MMNLVLHFYEIPEETVRPVLCTWRGGCSGQSSNFLVVQ